MSKLDDLRALEAKVVAGEWPVPREVRRAFPYIEIGVRDDSSDASLAMYGSLDAAKALHEAVLPGWGWQVQAMNTVLEPYVCVAIDNTTFEVRNSDPARAWLIAIIRALITEETT